MSKGSLAVILTPVISPVFVVYPKDSILSFTAAAVNKVVSLSPKDEPISAEVCIALPDILLNETLGSSAKLPKPRSLFTSEAVLPSTDVPSILKKSSFATLES